MVGILALMPVASAAAGRIIVASAGLGFVVVVSLLVMFIITASVSGAHSDAVMCGVMLGMWMLAGWCVSRAAFRAAAGEAEEEDGEIENSAKQKHEVESKRRKRHVWVQDGELLRAVEVELGISDSKYTELVSGNLKVEQNLVTGLQRGKK